MDSPRLNTLSVCTGIAGLDVGVASVLPTRAVCYVEREGFAIEHLAQKMQTGWLDEAPIWTDLTTFDGAAWRGRVDLIIGGVPCQPHSLAGKREQAGDSRDLVDAFLRVVGEVGPSLVLVENVRGFVSRDGLGRLVGGLAELGFDAEWQCVRASAVGAPHRRERVFVLAWRVSHPGSHPVWPQQRREQPERAREAEPRGLGKTVADPNSRGLQELGISQLLHGQRAPLRNDPHGLGSHEWPPGPDDAAGWEQYLERHPGTQPAIRRDVDGLAPRLDRLRALGNAVVPQQAAAALRALLARSPLDLDLTNP